MTIGIITIIYTEFTAICREFAIDIKISENKEIIKGDIYYKTSITSERGEIINIIVHFQRTAGNIAAGISTTKIIERFSPDFLFLCGIAAGNKNHCKIGDVVLGKNIGDNTIKLFKDGEYHPRYETLKIPKKLDDELYLYKTNVEEWVASIERNHDGFLNQQEYDKLEDKGIVNLTPSIIEDTVIVAADILIRDAAYFDIIGQIHDKNRTADMESAGFAVACEQRDPKVPWLVVRGISDFGDAHKKDDFQNRAASVAASWIGFFIRCGLSTSGYGFSEELEAQFIPREPEGSVVVQKNEIDAPELPKEVLVPPEELFETLKKSSGYINKAIRNENQ